MNCMIVFRCLLVIMAVYFSVCPAVAQQSIDSLLEEAQRNRNASTVYAERRDDDHRLYRITLMVEFRDEALQQRFVQAFENERQKSYSAIKYNSDKFVYKFRDSAGSSIYILMGDEDDDGKLFTVTKQWRADSSHDD